MTEKFFVDTNVLVYAASNAAADHRLPAPFQSAAGYVHCNRRAMTFE
jgi:hypothetical protein